MAETIRKTLASIARKTRLVPEPLNPIYCLFRRRLRHGSIGFEYNFSLRQVSATLKTRQRTRTQLIEWRHHSFKNRIMCRLAILIAEATWIDSERKGSAFSTVFIPSTCHFIN